MFDIEQLINEIADGFPLLFVGSGFSSLAKNGQDDPLPTGGGLSHLLQEELGYTRDYPLDILSREYKQQKGEHALLELLRRRLTAVHITEAQQYVSSLAWHRIYTTNYDNVVELARQNAGLATISVNVPLTPEVALTGSRVPVIHMNGTLADADIKTFDESLRLTRSSYLTESFISSNWLAQFRRDLSIASAILIVGYSTGDIDLARVLYADPTMRQRLFFVEPVDLDPVMKRELEIFGTVLDIGLEEFVNRAKKVKIEPQVRPSLRAFVRYEPVAPSHAASGDDVTKLLLYGDYDTAIQNGTLIDQKMYAIPRTAVRVVADRIAAGDRRFVVHSDLGNGKSIAVEQLRSALAAKGYHCFTLTHYDEFLEEDLSYLAGDDNPVVIVEDLFRNAKAIEKVLAALPAAPLVLTTRSAIFELQSEKLETLLGKGYLLHDLNALDNQEVIDLVDLFDANGLWADLSSRRSEEKIDFVQRVCGRQIRTVLIRLFESPSIRQKIVSTFQDTASGEALKIVVMSLMMDIAGFYPDLFVLNQLTGVDVYLARDKINNSFSLEFLDQRNGSVRVKSAVFGEYVLQNVVSSNYVLTTLIEAVRRCEVARASPISRDVFSELQKEMMRFSFVDRVFARKLAGDAYKRYYDSIKDLPSMARNPQFWLQYAIARLEDADFRASLIHFRTAYSHARPKGPRYDTFQIDNHYARFLLVSRTQDPSYKDDFKVFLEAHTLLIAQARRDKEAYYNYKVAREYLPFYRARCGEYGPEQLEVVKNACQDIRKQIEGVPVSVKKYAIIDQCYGDMEIVISDIERRTKH